LTLPLFGLQICSRVTAHFPFNSQQPLVHAQRILPLLRYLPSSSPSLLLRPLRNLRVVPAIMVGTSRA